MLSVSHLRKSFNHRSILSDVTFEISNGETVILMGKNGAGKTTLLRILARIMASDSGNINFQNRDLIKGLPANRKKLLYLGHKPGMYSALSALENLSLALNLRQTPVPKSTIISTLNQFGLSSQKNDPIAIYSKGMLQRLKLTYAILANWSLLLLDEPFSGLDEEGVSLMEGALKEWKFNKKTMCLVLHDESMATKYGDRILRLDNGIIN